MDRSKFKPAPMTAMKKLDSEIGQRRGYSDSFERADYHSIEAGENEFRLMPAHPDSEDPNFWMPKSVVWLSVTVDKYDENREKTGETEVKRKPVFTSDIHGPRELSGVDLIKSYVDYAQAKFKELFETEEEIKNAEKVLFDWKTGLKVNLSWVMYANKISQGGKVLGILEVSNGTKKKISKLASEIDSADDPLDSDPFTDPDEGIPLIINKRGKGLDTEYEVSLKSVKKGKFNVELLPDPLDDSDLEKLMNFKPLEKMFKNSFTRKDFEWQLEGLQRFDEDSEFNFFEEEEWLEKMETIKELVYDSIEEVKQSPKEEEEEEEKVEAPKRANAVSRVKTVETKRPEPEEEEEEEEETDDVREEPKPAQTSEDRLAAIRARLANKK